MTQRNLLSAASEAPMRNESAPAPEVRFRGPERPTASAQLRRPWITPGVERIPTGLEVTAYVASE
jgi:coenzyme PQQ precursor peptide PqqA